mgnify:CR=1 FL=1
MQTFLPYSDFEMSAKVLDYKRLGKQRVECLQILKVNDLVWCRTNDSKIAWENHPAVLMWRGYSNALYYYMQCICKEWVGRGYVDNCLEKARQYTSNYVSQCSLPVWIGNEEFHISHRSNLLRKNPDHYNRYFLNVTNDMPYIWPVRKKQ